MTEKRIIKINSLEDLASKNILFDVIKESEQKLEEAGKDPEKVKKIVEADKFLFIPSWNILSRPVIGFRVIEKGAERNKAIHIACNYDGGFLLPDLSDTHRSIYSPNGDKNLYDILVEFGYRKKLPIKQQGRSSSTCSSQFGIVEGYVGYGGFDWVKFKSNRYLEVEKEITKIKSRSFRRTKENEHNLPLPSLLICPIDTPVDEHLEYFDFKFRAADMYWGDGEFVAFVRHLGLGRKKPKYTFEKMIT